MGLIFIALHAMLVTYILPPFADSGQCYSVHVTILVLREVAAVNVRCQTLMPLAKLIFWLQWMRHWAHAWAVSMYLSVGCSGCLHFSLSCSSCLSSFRWCYSSMLSAGLWCYLDANCRLMFGKPTKNGSDNPATWQEGQEPSSQSIQLIEVLMTANCLGCPDAWKQLEM